MFIANVYDNVIAN